MNGPSKCARTDDMTLERKLYTDSEEEISIDDEYDNFPRHQ
jgi:hypothetical protein